MVAANLGALLVWQEWLCLSWLQECEQVLEVLRRQARQLEDQMRAAHKVQF